MNTFVKSSKPEYEYQTPGRLALMMMPRLRVKKAAKDGYHDELDLESGHKAEPQDGSYEQLGRNQGADDVGPSRVTFRGSD
ncbi:uncharacterized protein PgNI_08497 [Pyricularia grisea]|uniref:Uncharacterized protein n=1 Tax=Pyricularia grisea TaxID=148305 RepID=A0A6P8AVJ7_PYRGI|nr:uncharacterized protein PgNI_08497 [Pyricularia grisea]TLD06251.1 hypothetical protein PgNI_08497 [Pyricularia grisea]